MNPHIILTDLAKTESMDVYSSTKKTRMDEVLRSTSSDTAFISYVDELLNKPHESFNFGLLSPTEPQTSRHYGNQTTSANVRMMDLINLAILRSSVSSTKGNVNRFQINRGRDRVAVVSFARTAYRLGETVSAMVDFRNMDIPCYVLRAYLETNEVIDPVISLRSEASIQRATQRIYAQSSENTICAQRTSFAFMIPVTSPAQFITSGVRLQWRMRFEFVISSRQEKRFDEDRLLESVLDDERSKVLAAVQEIFCESFEVVVPIRVYGSALGNSSPCPVLECNI